MSPKQLRKPWQRALDANLTRISHLLRRRGPLNSAAVHDLRVSLRRTRLLLQLSNQRQARERIRSFRLTARKVMDTFAPPRDADVALEWAKHMHASPALLTRLLRERAKQCRRSEKVLKQMKSKLRAIKLKLIKRGDAEKLNRRFHQWTSAASARCLETIQRADPLSLTDLHELRRDIRRWRYLRELAATARPVARDRMVRVLVSTQESLGAIQDTEAILQQLKSCGRSREVTRLKQVLRRELKLNQRAALEEIVRLTKHLAEH